MKYTHIIWDFNGTLLCDMQTGIDSVNIMLKGRGLKTIDTIEEYRERFDFPIEDYYRSLGFDFEREPYSVLAPIWVDLYNERVGSAGMCDGARDVLEHIRGLNLKQLVLSACEINMLNEQTSSLGIRDYFSELIGLDNIHASGKVTLALAWREKNQDARALMIGDTTHDAKVALEIGADCLLYAGGHQSRERLLACNFPVIEHLSEIIEYL